MHVKQNEIIARQLSWKSNTFLIHISPMHRFILISYTKKKTTLRKCRKSCLNFSSISCISSGECIRVTEGRRM